MSALVAVAAIAAFAVIVGSWVNRLSIQPIRAATDVARAITAGRRDERVPQSPANTEAATLGSAMNLMLDTTAETEARIRSFVADASHELRTPLTTLIGYADLHRQGLLTSDAAVDDAMRRIRGEAKRMSSIVEHLFLLANLDEGTIPIGPAEVAVGQLLADVAADARVVQSDREITVDVPAQIEVAADPERLLQGGPASPPGHILPGRVGRALGSGDMSRRGARDRRLPSGASDAVACDQAREPDAVAVLRVGRRDGRRPGRRGGSNLCKSRLVSQSRQSGSGDDFGELIEDLDDGFDIDEEGGGDLTVVVSRSEVNDNRDEGMDMDEAGDGSIVGTVIKTEASRNGDEGYKASEEDAGDNTADISKSTFEDAGNDQIEVESENGDGSGTVTVNVSKITSTGADGSGVKAVEDDGGTVLVTVDKSTLADNGEWGVEAEGGAGSVNVSKSDLSGNVDGDVELDIP